MLPTCNFEQLCNSNRWCGDGRGFAKGWWRRLNHPEKITVAHLVQTARRSKGINKHPYRQGYFLTAVCRLLDKKTANQVMENLKGKPTYYKSTFSWYPRRRSLHKRRYPAVITRGRQLRELLGKTHFNDALDAIEDAIKDKI